jgi:competence protein ComFC
MGRISDPVRFLSSLFMPALCLHCRKDRWGATPLCLTCLRRADPLRPSVCGAPGFPDRAGSDVEAREKADEDSPIASMEFLFRMGPQLSTLIHGFKYRHMRRNIRFLCEYLRYRPDLREWARNFDVMAPVPIHSVRRRERGYNQAAEIALDASLHLGLPVLQDALRRVRATTSQTKLNRQERGKNLDNAFACGNPGSVRGKRVLLVDDVYTTGATVGRCAELLAQAGAASVGVLALARVEVARDLDDFELEMEAVSSYAG